ncbi:MAG: acyl-CoA dehydrogenase family protein [Coriobacteriia bacterium]|nr:acyl-CoA dehydrogenase family protein [Coriobacteriia bacterium]
MSYFLTEDQKLIVQSVNEFCQNSKIQELAAECRATGKVSRELWSAMAEQGYVGATIPEEYGGMGYDFTTLFLIAENLALNSFPLMGTLTGHCLGILPILFWGSDEIKTKYLPRIASGELLLCGSVTDPAGMGNFPEWGLKEEKVEGGWKLNGTKVLSTNADIADLKVVFGRPEEGHSMFDHVYLIEKGSEGLVTGQQEKKLVPDCSDWGSVVMNDVFVPDENRIDDNGTGYYWFGLSFSQLALSGLAMSLGCFKMAFGFTSQRTRYGRPLTALQSVSHKLADMAIRNEINRSLIYNCVRLWDEGRGLECYRLGCAAKAFVTEGTNKTAHDAAVLHGGIGYTTPAIIGPMYASSLQLELAEMPGDLHRDFLMETYGVKPGWKNGQA